MVLTMLWGIIDNILATEVLGILNQNGLDITFQYDNAQLHEYHKHFFSSRISLLCHGDPNQ